METRPMEAKDTEILSFQKDLIVWKPDISLAIRLFMAQFQKDLIVWKLKYNNPGLSTEKSFRRT